MNKICFFNRSSVHYRKNIYMLMDKELPCDFYFGDSRPSSIKPVDVSLLNNFKGYFHNISVFGPYFWQKGALKLLKSDYTDIITPGETNCLSTWLLLLLSRLFKKRVYLWTHGAYGDEKGIKKWITKLRIKLCAGAFLYGNYAKDILIKYKVNPSKLHVIYNSLSYDEQIEIRNSLEGSDFYQQHFLNNNPNLVFIGRLTKVKKLDQILIALKKLSDQGCKCNMTFVGDGNMKDTLISMANSLGIEKSIWFYGACYDEKKISDFLYNADVCISPGNVGLTAMHAMVFGTPVISHDNFPKQMPEFEAIENGLTGTFFKENDTESLAQTIRLWLSTHIDREITRKACYKVIDEKYNPHVQLITLTNTIKKNK